MFKSKAVSRLILRGSHVTESGRYLHKLQHIELAKILIGKSAYVVEN